MPYYLACYPGHEDLDLFQHTGNKYESVASNAEGRYALPELELEVAIREGWARFWFRGELVRLPGEIQHEVINTKTRSPRKRRGAAGAAKAADKRIPELQEAEQPFQRLLVNESNGKKKK